MKGKRIHIVKGPLAVLLLPFTSMLVSAAPGGIAQAANVDRTNVARLPLRQ